MELNNLPTHELGIAARAEADAFELPPGWQDGRDQRTGFAIDQSYSPDIDDAVSFSRVDGATTLHVSIADTGSFLPEQVAISRYARRAAWSKYRGKSVVASMIPRSISEDKLSLLHDQERPVVTVHVPIDTAGQPGFPTVTRDVLRAHQITPAKVEDLIYEGQTQEAVALRGLDRIARRLFAARHDNAVNLEDFVLEDADDGEPLGMGAGQNVGDLIVCEAAIAASRTMPLFMQANDIPCLFRNQVIPEELWSEAVGGYSYERSVALARLARATYGTAPEGHASLNLPMYMHITSPLRRFPDFANHANLVAFLESRPYPYPEDRLQRIADRLQYLALKQAGQLAGRPHRMPQPGFSPYRRASYVLEKFADNTAGPGELATALFNVVGSDEQAAEARAAAARYAAANIHHARPALEVALARRLVRLRPAERGEAPHGVTQMLEDDNGNVYPYINQRTSPLSQSVASARLIGTIAGVELEPIIPYKLTREGRIMEDGFRYLRFLASENRLQLRWQIDEKDGEIQAGLLVTIGDKHYNVGGSGPSRNVALQKAAVEVIEDYDLINNMPPVMELPPDPNRREIEKDPAKNPIVLVQKRLSMLESEQAEYVLSELDENGNRVCTIRVVVGDDVYEATAEGRDKRETKQRAARLLLPQLPPATKGRNARKRARAEAEAQARQSDDETVISED
jgi:hypothetical protein